MRKPLLFLSIAVICANMASAAYVDLATPDNSANLTFSISDSALAWSKPSQSFVLDDAGYASASLERTDWMLQVGLGLHDKESAIALAEGPVGPTFAYQQLSISFFNFTTDDVTFSEETLSISIADLFSAEPAHITGFIFTGPDAIVNESNWDASYNAVDGTLTFSNSDEFTLLSGDSLWLHGQFTVIPEPASFAALAGLLGAGYALYRRRIRG